MAYKFTKKQVLDAVKASHGVVDVVAARLGCAWPTAREWIGKWPETQAALEEGRSRMNSLIVSKYAIAVQNGERWAIERGLDTMARRVGLGIVAHQQIDHTSNGETINRMVVEYIDPKPQPPPDAPPPNPKKARRKTANDANR
jgi:hypothetical protein